MAKKQTTHQKGLELENKFAKYMKEKLEYDDRAEIFRVISIITLVLSIMGSILCIAEVIPFEWVSFFLVLEIGAIIYAFLSRYFSSKYTAVECKNHENKI